MSRFHLLKSLKFVALTLFSSALIAGPGIWTVNGPDGGALQILQTSAANPNRVYVGSFVALFRSDDAGLSFSRLAPTTDLGFFTALAVSPSDANVLYLVGDRLRKSTDGGDTWTELTVLAAPDPLFAPTDLKIGPANTLFLTTRAHGLHKSSDGGATWVRLATGSVPINLSRVAVDPTNPLRITVSPCADDVIPFTGLPMLQSLDGGSNFVGVAIPGLVAGEAFCATALDYSANTSGVVLAQSQLGPLVRSTDGGASYSAVAPAATPFDLSGLQFLSATQLLASNSNSP